MAVLGDIISLDLPNGDEVTLRDDKASHYLGKTTSAITDGGTTNPVVIGGNNVTAVAYDWVIVGSNNAMFQFDGTNWTAIAKGAAVNDSTITITTTGEADQTFSTNQASASTIDIPVPVKGIQVNGVDVTPDSSTHKVNVIVPVGPMVIKGTLGAAADNPTITALPTDGSADVGDTYKVITAGTYNGQAAKVGDAFSCLTKTTTPTAANTWLYIPAGDDVTAVGAQNGLVTNVGTNDDITTTGKIGLNLKSSTPGSVATGSVSGTGRHIPVSLDSAGQVETVIPAGELSATVSDVTANNTVVTSLAAQPSSSTQPSKAVTGMYSYDNTNRKLKLNWLTAPDNSNAVFKTTTP